MSITFLLLVLENLTKSHKGDFCWTLFHIFCSKVYVRGYRIRVCAVETEPSQSINGAAGLIVFTNYQYIYIYLFIYLKQHLVL